MFSGRTVDAATALQMGMVNDVVGHAELMAAARAKAEELTSVSPSALKATKRVLNDMAQREHLPESLLYSREVVADLSKTEDFKEGVQAFVEKRKPNWVNK